MTIDVEYGPRHPLGRLVSVAREDGTRVPAAEWERYLAHLRLMASLSVDERVAYLRTLVYSVPDPDLRACVELDHHLFAGHLHELERHANTLAASPSGTAEEQRGLEILFVLQRLRRKYFGTVRVRGGRTPGTTTRDRKVDAASAHLKAALVTGPKTSAEVRALAAAHGISWPTMRRAARALRVEMPAGRGSRWRLRERGQRDQAGVA